MSGVYLCVRGSPTEALMKALGVLSEDPKNEVFVISGLQLLPLEVSVRGEHVTMDAREVFTWTALGRAPVGA